MTDLIDKQKLDNALRRMGTKHLKPQFRDLWKPERPTTGYCYVVAEVVYHYLAPKGSRPYIIKFDENDTHWFVKEPSGKVIDLTADQFDVPIDYTLGKPKNFQTKDISKRGRLLANLLDLTKDEKKETESRFCGEYEFVGHMEVTDNDRALLALATRDDDEMNIKEDIAEKK
jgi:hypothetical protein